MAVLNAVLSIIDSESSVAKISDKAVSINKNIFERRLKLMFPDQYISVKGYLQNPDFKELIEDTKTDIILYHEKIKEILNSHEQI